MIPVRTPFFLPYVYPSLVWRVNTSKNELFLSFDDGPVSGPTEFVLDTLRDYESKATFFCIGDNIRKYPQIFQKVLAGGHTVGNHTYNHLNGWKTPLAEYIRNIDQCTDQIRQHTEGIPPDGKMLFRPPYGRVTFREIRALTSYQIVMWDVLTKDFDSSVPGETCLRRSILATRRGSIIVFHDSMKAERNLRFVLPRFLAHFREKGFVFKPLDL
ncbi:MAG TPA: polysaccharide deacetylase family protein [Chryseosolibacter sp.]|nr:polysaccharide deacetylase family protein [Chryseosolibacter sp.]